MDHVQSLLTQFAEKTNEQIDKDCQRFRQQLRELSKQEQKQAADVDAHVDQQIGVMGEWNKKRFLFFF